LTTKKTMDEIVAACWAAIEGLENAVKESRESTAHHHTALPSEHVPTVLAQGGDNLVHPKG
jgi:hypothetical protein